MVVLPLAFALAACSSGGGSSYQDGQTAEHASNYRSYANANAACSVAASYIPGGDVLSQFMAGCEAAWNASYSTRSTSTPQSAETSTPPTYARVGTVGRPSVTCPLLPNGMCKDADLANLSYAGGNIDADNIDLSGADLSNSVLPGANLKKAKLSHANLTNTIFANQSRSATLYGAELVDANLTGTVLSSGTEYSDLEWADLKGANVNSPHMGGVNLSHANLTKADLHGTNLQPVAGHLTATIWSDTICPDGTNSNKDGGTCLYHLTPTPR